MIYDYVAVGFGLNYPLVQIQNKDKILSLLTLFWNRDICKYEIIVLFVLALLIE